MSFFTLLTNVVLKNGICKTLFFKLSWSHIVLILKLSNPESRNYYITETAENSWSVRTLDRNIATQYYERLLLSHAKEPIKKEMRKKTAEFQLDKKAFIKSPSVLEFLDIPTNAAYTEIEREKLNFKLQMEE